MGLMGWAIAILIFHGSSVIMAPTSPKNGEFQNDDRMIRSVYGGRESPKIFLLTQL